jgi:tetratricopeptide (TPR) repeat protein
VAGLLLVLASLYLLRGRHLARLAALDNLQRFRDESSATRLLSIIPDPEPEELEEAGRLGRQALGRYGVLDVADQERLRGDAGELLLLLARNSRLRAGTESDPHRRGELLRQALELNTRAETTPAHGELLRAIRLQRASLLRQTGQDQDAARLLQEAERMPLRSATDRLLAALEYLGRGEYRQAHPLLLEASRQEPTNPLVWSALGEYYTASGQLDKAADHYNTAIALQPAFYRTYYLRGRAHLLRKDHVQAGADFDRALRLRPGFVPAHLDRAVARLESKDLRGALQDLDRALEGNPQHMRAFFMRSRVRQVLGDAAGARADFEAGLQREPTDEQSWIARGVARVPRDPQGALADFEAAARRNPRSRVALVNQAHVLAERLGRTDEAVRALDQVVALFPEYVPGRASRGVLLARLGRREAALNDAQESLLRDTGPAVTYQVAGIYALTSRQHPEDQAEAYRLLGSALRRGYGRELLAQDRDLDPLRDQPEFQRLIEATKTPRTGAGPTN